MWRAPTPARDGNHGRSRPHPWRPSAVRRILYMAAVTASRHNPILRLFYRRLIDKGKPAKLALISALRRLVVFANAVLKTGQPWKGANAS
jgi:transposase